MRTIMNLDKNVKTKDNVIYADQSCGSLSLRPLYIQVGKYAFHITKQYYAYEDMTYGTPKCKFLFKINNNNNGYDGYILGAPFLRAFTVVLD